ncbi:S1 family peptidase [Haladaptatus sp. DYF46]|uniref:S1 family peptidase n=1 Tax=Haladaptatus sp. DYF46 TaxID=2886041 RepID=UPI001E4BFD41|nr:S1 family peptidase [Haladaptatus sp. DYF46]
MPEEHGEQGRRTYLKKLGGMVGIGSIPSFDILGMSSTTTIPIAMSGETVMHSEKVNKKWLDQTKQARNALEETRERHKDQFQKLSLSPISDSIQGRRKMGIKMYVENNINKVDLPDKVDGIKINIVDAEPLEPNAWPCHGAGLYYSLPGGGQVEDGTACCRVKDDSGTFYLLTAAHLFDACSSNPGGDEATHAGNRIGYVNEWHTVHDWVGIKRDNDNDIYFNNKIFNGDGNREQVTGYLTYQAMVSWSSSQQTVYKYGCSTGKTSGHISDVSVYGGFDCVDMDGYGVELSATTAGGDSGGPLYADMASGVYMIGVNSYRTGSNMGTICSNPSAWTVGGFGAYRLASSAGAGFTFAT